MGAYDDGGMTRATPQKVTLAEAKTLGFESTQGITKSGGMYHFAESLASDRGGFQSVGVAKAGEAQMTPYYGDVTGAYRLNQEQYAQAAAAAKASGNISDKTNAILAFMRENELKAGGGVLGGIVNQQNEGFSSSLIEPTPSTPTITPAITAIAAVVPVKTATPDIVIFDDESVPVDIMADLIFENIGGQELINVARNDTVNGQQIIYQPIKNLSVLQQQFNPNNIVSLQQTSDKYFAGFSIKLEDKVPTPGTGPNGEHVYIDTDTGDLIIETINILSDEQIEVEITTDGTIYEAVF